MGITCVEVLVAGWHIRAKQRREEAVPWWLDSPRWVQGESERVVGSEGIPGMLRQRVTDEAAAAAAAAPVAP